MNTSLFGRLFTYARGGAADALENFTTEALAAAIRADPRPFVDVLDQIGVLRARPGTTATVETQLVVPDCGIIDLAATLATDTRLLAEVWVEVKVYAGESGDQLERYRRHIGARPAWDRPTLVTLSRFPFARDPEVRWIPWQAVWSIVGRTNQPHPFWLEFRRFLEESDMADDAFEPISAREAASLGDASRLLAKALRVLTEVNGQAALRWPAVKWAAKRQVEQAVLGQFQTRGRFTMYTSRELPILLELGLVDVDGEAQLVLWVESDPKRPAIREKLLERADEGGLGPEWRRQVAGWVGLSASRRATTIEGHEATVSWFMDRLADLDGAGVLRVHEGLGNRG